ncbi:pectinesterase inhibitor 3-like [Cicer arietinum]|uniref:Pectinesterase inhibitor 3-like n=1 Tax=Cicer arietinum TaxID=3827 RepID=A0A1S3ED74_CICAR|nr:pectinesterase inhibitor 3-like [Cicer arietinum]
MQTRNSITFLVFSLLLISPTFLSAAKTPQDLIRSSCAQARYPTLCVQTLSNQVGPTTKPLNLAQAAVNATLTHALTLSVYFNTLQSHVALGPTVSNRLRVAVSDCVEQISDSVTELNRTLNELRHLRMGTFEWQMSNAQTWASTALTNGNSCINGLNRSDAEKKMKLEVKRRVTDLSMLTSNALYLINRVSDSRNPKPHSSNSKN